MPIEGLVQVNDGSRWLRLTDPVHIVEAHRPEDVRPCLREVETLVRSRGWHALGFVTYEAGEAFGLSVDSSPQELPLVWFAMFDATNVRSLNGIEASDSYELGPLAPSISREQFLADFDRIREHLAGGDTYQVNYTFALRGNFRGDPAGLFADLVAAQGGRYGAYLRLPTHTISSASPELFFRREKIRLQPDPTHPSDATYTGDATDAPRALDMTLDNAEAWSITARPMKGTARRGRTVAEDRVAAEQLQRSAKEQAENVMVVDMVRNDLGRVAAIGSVETPELFALEPYPNVWQMTSTITARATAPLDELLAALFPSASVTGAPKVRTMEIIKALERRPRGVYTGAVGYVAPDGSAQFNVAIRTAVVDHGDGTVEFGVGSGIVWDSNPEREYEECLLKGSVMGQRRERFELLETMRWTPAEGFALIERHVVRLKESAKYWGFRCDVDRIRVLLDDAVRDVTGPLRVRLLVAADGVARVERTPLGDAANTPEVLRLTLAADPVDPADAFLFHKTTNRRTYDRARPGGPNENVEVVLWNPRREVTEATMANIVVEIDGRRVTPPVECGLLPGTLREELLASGEIVEAVVTIDELRASPRIWLINSVRGWRLGKLEATENRKPKT